MVVECSENLVKLPNINKKIERMFYCVFFFTEIKCSVRGYYRIYAVDYWYIRGPPSKPAEYSD